MKKIIGFIFLLLVCGFVHGQELNTRVQILAPNISNINKKNLEVLQKTIRDFLNNNKWTNETYLPQERIECNFVITITSWDGSSAYTAEAQIQSSRPVYGSSYYSTLLNINDKDFDFNYNDGQSLDFSDQNFITNLSSLLGYYAYTIIGLDKDSFSKLAGTSYFNKAQNVLNVAQISGNKGWKAFDGLRNRYWLNENLLNTTFKELRVFIYDYHFNGLDKMQDNVNNGAKNILALLPALQQMDKQKLGSIFPNVYFASKADEITNVLSIIDLPEKIKAFNLLSDIDPANISKYEVLKKAR
ncbi:type IX secretion system protein PorD [Pedobacter boryungensis]|uniref:DUF4835 family protein n=1 Tax=Pedobacter boryungensis TaxID=869962 RepID=A0ABX2DEF7_9SPHI|nr:DUF4835 family protein [Pedobacter boryungensis]NQX32476.1 DUF4835 family protein [Pedobacter boryungensis]